MQDSLTLILFDNIPKLRLSQKVILRKFFQTRAKVILKLLISNCRYFTCNDDAHTSELILDS